MKNYFLSEPITIGGVQQTPLGAADLAKLGAAEQMCCSHINAVLGLQTRDTHDRYRLALLADLNPDATCFSKSRDDIGIIRFTTGLLSLACVLSARCAVIMDEGNFLTPWMPAFRRSSPTRKSLDTPLSFGNFNLSDAKRNVTGLNPQSIAELAGLINSDIHLAMNAIRLACTAMEFLVLHELGHFDAQHDEIRRTNKAQITLAVQRVFEHQADIFAVRLMITMGISRPITDGRAMMPKDPDGRKGANILVYIGAALAMSLMTLLRAKEPTTDSSIDLIHSLKGEHPLPTTRLIIADRQIQSELKDPASAAKLWPGAGEMERITLAGMTRNTLFLALTTLAKDWRSAIDHTHSNDPLPPNLKYWFDDDAEVEATANSLTPEAMAQAIALVKNAAVSAPPKT